MLDYKPESPPEPRQKPRATNLRAQLRGFSVRMREAVGVGHPHWRRTRQSVYEIAKTLVIAFLLAQLIMVSVAQAFQVEQYSMEPTLLPHDRVLVSKFIYRLRSPQRGDVIVLRYPRNPSRNYIKRVIGLPGEKLHVKEGKVLVNGRAISEAYLNGHAAGDYGPVTVPKDAVFVMGDNRNNSEDSRAFGPLKREFIVGQAVLIYWPPQRLRALFRRGEGAVALPLYPPPLGPGPPPNR